MEHDNWFITARISATCSTENKIKNMKIKINYSFAALFDNIASNELTSIRSV